MENIVKNLENNIKCLYKRNLDTPRAAFCLNFAICRPEVVPGVYSIMARLLFQGTKTKTAEQIAEEFDACGIDFAVEMKQDYLRFRFLCLNEDFAKSVELVTDLIMNSTFEEFDKEKAKIAGEITASLDGARAKAVDNYVKTLYDGHYYGYTDTKVLENLDNITKEQVVKAYEDIFNNGKKVLTFVGDIPFEEFEAVINSNLGELPCGNDLSECPLPAPLSEKKEVEIIKPDANQAHIMKGWRAESFDSEDYPALILLSIILGASGLSSRLFLELRDKKGLAYVVRSSYESLLKSASFSIYIATEPKNIDVCLEGFEKEIEKIKNIPVSEEELDNAKNNALGKWAFLYETNSQQACSYAHYGILGLGFDFNDKAKTLVKSVTVGQLQACANKYFNDKFVLSVLKP